MAPGRAAAALLVLLALPFLARAYGIDEPLYVAAARHVLEEPWRPLAGPSFWHERPTTLFHDSYNPPLVAYLLAIPVALAGGAEWAAHLLTLLLGAAALVASARLGVSLGAPACSVWLLAASPALAAASVTAMADVPFLLLSVLAWSAARRGAAGAGGALLGLSALTKYAGVLNAPLVWVALRRRSARAAWLALLVAAALFGAWCLWNLATQGALHVLAAGRFQHFALERQGRFLYSFAAALGLVGLPAALPLLRPGRAATIAAPVAAAAAGWATWTGSGSASAALIAAAGLGAGAALLVAALAATPAALREEPLAPLAFWAYAGYSVLLVYFFAARYLLPLLPPLVWLLARGGRLALDSRPRLAAGVALGAALSLALLRADAGFAGAWRDLAGRLPAGTRPLGHWGFQYYARAGGARPLAPRDELAAGTPVAVAREIHVPPLSPAHAARLSAAGTLEAPSPALRVMDRRALAGFYSDHWGALPLGLRRGARETVDLFRVAPLPRPSPRYESAPRVQLGSEHGRHVLLDGWSEPESFSDGGVEHRFVWGVGGESALRLAVPAAPRALYLRAAPSPEAVGPLEVRVGELAVTLELEPGWREYRVALRGRTEPGWADVVLRPAGHRRPGLFDPERRPLSVAVEWLGLGASADGERGVWPVPDGELGPSLFLAGTVQELPGRPGERASGRLRRLDGEARLSWGGAALWDAGGCAPGAVCDFQAALPEREGPLLLEVRGAALVALTRDR